MSMLPVFLKSVITQRSNIKSVDDASQNFIFADFFDQLFDILPARFAIIHYQLIRGQLTNFTPCFRQS